MKTVQSSLFLFCFALTLCVGSVTDAEDKKVLLIAGARSHGYGSHEHYAGCRLLEDTLNKANVGVKAETVRLWPEDTNKLDEADTIVIYCDGGGRHITLKHVEEMQRQIKRGVGFVCIHYAVEVPTGEPGNHFLNWLGGYFETHWSVNPHWTAVFDALPEHPVTNGVDSFSANDEWYYHMRFREGMDGVTPILSDVPPEDTLRRKDGAHSGNPHVRKAVAKKEAQHVAWTFDRPDGGRSFGFTGGHHHWNWGSEPFRRVVANGILWTTGAEVPKGGVGAKNLKMSELEANQDYDKPAKFKRDEIQERFGIQASAAPRRPSGSKGKELFKSKLVNATTVPSHQIDIQVDLGDAKEIALVASDGGNGNAFDWVDWINPRLSGPSGEKSLLDLDWTSATSGWGNVHKNKNAGGGPLSVRGQTITLPGIGTHANSTITFKVPSGYDKLLTSAALDTGGTSQADGQEAAVCFAVYADGTPQAARELTAEELRDPKNAISGITIGEGLEATLTAHEPDLKSLTNIDVDARGRIWACEVMNYRHNNGSRTEGDRILILEDTDKDGVADDVKVFFQGRDVDSAMGICVLGNKVIVSATPNVWVFTDEDGDDKPDSQVALFTKTGRPQHDHSAHSFLFGPDGMLYWNFGNTGGAVHDARGEPVVDRYGRTVVDNGKPFYGGMPFRCNMDGSNFEVLAHNFRNNYEVTVDSFGTLWQSDNDDDGNRAVRINYVMEQGNFGYRDELTGAGWRDARIGMHDEVPLRHWHLRDPGVVPNLLQTGAGSPTGIMVYEGRLLPERFWDQMIHCDAGPNVVRAYPTKVDGAGYSAEMENIMLGERDPWFRPADVCAAPDGSIFVSDWYDPGVGGHRQGDLDRGRLFRLAPPGTKYEVPTYDYSTAAGAAEALRNPASSVRYLAWQALHAMGDQAEEALVRLWKDKNPRVRARALWLLGKIEGRGTHYVSLALSDDDSDIRITGLRLARHLELDVVSLAARVADDTSAAVRREAALALRFQTSPDMPKVWAQLAKHYDGRDRWYLEALGIGSDLRADECFGEWIDSVGDDWDSPAGRGIVWRVRSEKAAPYVGKLIQQADESKDDTSKYFRALEYHDKSRSNDVLREVAESDVSDETVVRAAERISGMDWKSSERIRAAVERSLASSDGTDRYLDLVRTFNPEGATDSVLKMALSKSETTEGVNAAAFLLKSREGRMAMRAEMVPTKSGPTKKLTSTLGMVGSKPAVELLNSLLNTKDAEYEFQSSVVRGLGRNNLGRTRLVELAEAKKLPGDVRLLAGSLVHKDAKLKERAAKVLPLPVSEDRKPMRPIGELSSLRGDSAHGAMLFAKEGTCANCHQVNGNGKEVGPDLSEIGKKLSREAMLVSILDPSAGISHNYENFTAILTSGQVVTGVKVSETSDALTLRTAEAIDRKLDRNDIDALKKSDQSIMPQNLHHALGEQGLVDVVEYLLTLKQKS